MRLFKGMNTDEDVKHISADMFNLNATKKAFFYKILRLIKPMPPDWLADLEGNAAVLRDIYLELLENEDCEWIRENEIRAIPFLLRLLEDPPYDERFCQWFLYRICQEYERGRFSFDLAKIRPACWYRDKLGRRLDIRISQHGEYTISKVTA